MHDARNPLLRHYTLSCSYCGRRYDDNGLILDCSANHEPALLRTQYADDEFRPFTDREGIFRYQRWLPVTGEQQDVEGTGNGPISAFCAALSSVGIGVRVLDYAEHALTEGTDAQAAAYVEVETGGTVLWGVGIDTNTATASMRAILSAVNRSRRA